MWLFLPLIVMFCCENGKAPKGMGPANETHKMNGDTPMMGNEGGAPQSESSQPTGVWPISGTLQPDCIQDGFGHRILNGRNDFHPGVDTCNDDPAEIEPTVNQVTMGLPVHVVLGGIVTRVRRWDPEWNDTRSDCPALCRQGNFVMVRHTEIEPYFNDQIVQTVYMHLANDTLTVAEGDAVTRGTVLGRVGKTGLDINTVHLHLGLLVGPSEGRIDIDRYVNPLRVLPFVPRGPRLSIHIKDDARVFGPNTCPDATKVMVLNLAQFPPALSLVRLEATLPGGATNIVDFDKRIGVGIDGTHDNFQQGCTAIEVDEFRKGSTEYNLRLHFAVDGPSPTEVSVVLTDVRGQSEQRAIQVE